MREEDERPTTEGETVGFFSSKVDSAFDTLFGDQLDPSMENQ
jgi:hypothetical protein